MDSRIGWLLLGYCIGMVVQMITRKVFEGGRPAKVPKPPKGAGLIKS